MELFLTEKLHPEYKKSLSRSSKRLPKSKSERLDEKHLVPAEIDVSDDAYRLIIH